MAQVKEVVIVRKMSQFRDGSLGLQFGIPVVPKMLRLATMSLCISIGNSKGAGLDKPSMRNAGFCLGAASFAFAVELVFAPFVLFDVAEFAADEGGFWFGGSNMA